MILKITYPYKNDIASLEYKSIYIQTDDKQLIESIKSIKNPIEIGVILSENEEKYKIISPTKEDEEIIFDEIIANPNLRLHLPEN